MIGKQNPSVSSLRYRNQDILTGGEMEDRSAPVEVGEHVLPFLLNHSDIDESMTVGRIFDYGGNECSRAK